jgi:hypothetical protein
MSITPVKVGSVVTALGGVAVVTLLASCGDSGSTSVEPTLTSLWDNYFNGCALNCHSPGVTSTVPTGPDLSTKQKFYDNLVNKTVNNDYPLWIATRTGTCNAVRFIMPGSANDSTVAASLIDSISSTVATTYNCDTAYNLHVVNRVDLGDSEIRNALVEWIDQGASNN